MRLEFRLLVVDDDAKSVKASILSLEDYLETEGFVLVQDLRKSLSEEEIRSYGDRHWRQFDLVMVDYNLSSPDNGADVVKALRGKMRFTETVFYSMGRTKGLYQEIAERDIQGVFVAERDELDEVLPNLAHVVIGKTVDVIHARGSAMAEVADIDARMEDTLRRVLETATDGTGAGVVEQIEEEYRKRRRTLGKRVEKELVASGLVGVLDKGPMFGSLDRWRAIRALAKRLTHGPGSEVDVVGRYSTEILDKRNLLAHVRQEEGKDGTVVLRSRRSADAEGVVIDDEWMRGFRNDLRRHREAADAVCRAIHEEFVGRVRGRSR